MRGRHPLLLTLLVLAASARPPAAAAGPAPPAIGAAAAVLMDARTGAVLFARAPDLRWPPASTTKILTALLVAETLPMDALVPISPRAAAERSGSAIGLEVGERWKVGDLLHALLLHSANDAAVALAEAVAGSVEEFARQMTARAGRLGAKRSRFVTPHGRYHPDHLSTAYDLALIARAALAVPALARIVGLPTWDLLRPGQPPRRLINTNRLLWRYPGADGVKTGWVAESGPSLVASATRQGVRLIAVLLNAPQVYADAAALLNYGFAAYAPQVAARAGQVLATAEVAGGARPLRAAVARDVVLLLPRGAAVSVRATITATRAPIARGQPVGTAAFVSQGAELARVPLVALEDVPVWSVWSRLRALLRRAAGGGSGEP